MADYLLKFLPIAAAFGAGFFAILRWIDLRRREVADDEFEKVFRLIMIVTGQHPNGHGARILDQVAAVWMLKEYPKYHVAIRRALDRKYDDIVKSQDFLVHVEPEIRAMLAELPKRGGK